MENCQPSSNLSPFELVGLLTHVVVFTIGLGGLVGFVPLARSHHSGLGLVWMALSMTILVLEPRWHLSVPAAGAYAVSFVISL